MGRLRISLPLLLLIGGAPGFAPAARTAASPAGYPAGVEEPIVRIGLSTNGVTARFSSVGGIEVYDGDGGRVWKEVHRGDLFVVAEPPEGQAPASDRFVIQVASFADEENAESYAAELEERMGETTTVKFNPDSSVYRVRIGSFPDETSAFELTERLRQEGYEELWVAEDPEKMEGAARLRLVDDSYLAHLSGSGPLTLVPHRSSAFLKANGVSYRGLLEVRIDPYGRLQVINVVNIEDYLRGVVPGEMGPSVYPEIEALKAQAVAARTYIVRNLGQFSELGYDICATPRCQVYHGLDGEHPLTDRAIRETRGQVLVYKGVPINAMYTSTCGGHTENVEGVFPQRKSPYLRGVPCYPERPEVIRVRGERVQPVIRLEDGTLANAELAWMRILGVLLESDLDPDYLAAAASPDEIALWWGRVRKLIGKPAGGAGPVTVRTLRDLSRLLVEELDWQPRIDLFTREKDVPQVVAFDDASLLDAGEKRRFGYLLHVRVLRPFPDNTLRPDHTPSRGLVLRTLYDVARLYDSLFLEEGKFLAREGNRFRIGGSLESEVYRLSPDAYLFRPMSEERLPAEELVLYPGDRLRYHRQEDLIDWIEMDNAGRGLSDDRSSPLSRWEVRYEREELEEILQDRFSLGRLEDIEIVERGVSGRVTELLVTGSRGPFRIRGFRIRTALRIRETLFVLDRQYALDGSVRAFIFTGRGWGHGVGLCQVGAYGMALRREKYDTILHHYYSGVKLRKDYGAAFPRP